MRSAKRLLLAYAYSSSNFFFRRNKNNNSNDRWFALESIFLSLSLSLFLSPCRSLLLFLSDNRLPSLGEFSSLPIAVGMAFFSFPLPLSTSPQHESGFLANQSSFCAVRRLGEEKCVYVRGRVLLLPFDKSRLFCPSTKMCARVKGRELIKHFRRLLHDLLISQLKRPYTHVRQGEMAA